MRNIAKSDIPKSRSLETKTRDLWIETLQMVLTNMIVMIIITNNTGPRRITQAGTVVHRTHLSRFRVLAGVGTGVIIMMDAVMTVVMIGDAVSRIVRKVMMIVAVAAVNIMVYYSGFYADQETAE